MELAMTTGKEYVKNALMEHRAFVPKYPTSTDRSFVFAVSILIMLSLKAVIGKITYRAHSLITVIVLNLSATGVVS